MRPASIIARKRDGEELAASEIEAFVLQYAADRIPDYQMAAFAMAVYFQGMSLAETVALTQAMVSSGECLQWPASCAPRVDKHSTGGVGDKVSLVLVPMLACCDLLVPMLSGRGLGTTGGTLDKLESIEGFRVDLSPAEIVRNTLEVGCVITGASAELAPADRKMYELRDVTGTVPSRPLIVASILSKKLAEGLSSLVLDVKHGRGALSATLDEARELARQLVDVGCQLGIPTVALLTNMDEPLGHAIGNALEVNEALCLLEGDGPGDVRELCLQLGVELLQSVGVGHDEARRQLEQSLHSGAARERFERMVQAQGGRLGRLETAAASVILAEEDGYVHSIDARRLAEQVVEWGGGRRTKADVIDHGVGAEILVKVGDRVERGQAVARVHARGTAMLSPGEFFLIREDPRVALPLVAERIEK